MADIKIAGRIKAGAADNIAGYASEILFDDEASNKTVKEKLEGKQDTLTFDNVPTKNSNNPVKSGGVYQAIQSIDVSGQISGKADKSEMSVVAGTGANADKTTITLKSGTSATVLTQHQDVSEFLREGEVFGSGGDSAASFNSYADTVWNKQQTLSESQKQQVRENIGIADLETIRNGAAAGVTAIQSVTVGTTTTGAAGSSASVVNSGTATAPVLDFTIPQGAQGVKGDTVIMGNEDTYTLYNTTGDAVDGAMTQQAVTRELAELSGKESWTETILHNDIDISTGVISVNLTWLAVGNQNYKHGIVQVEGCTKISFTATADYALTFAFLKSYNPVTGQSADLCDGTQLTGVSKGQTKEYDLPEDCKYVYFRALDSGASQDVPETITLTFPAVEGVIEELEESINSLNRTTYGGVYKEDVFVVPTGSPLYAANNLEEGVTYKLKVHIGTENWVVVGFGTSDTATYQDSDFISIFRSLTVGEYEQEFVAPDPAIYPYIVTYKGSDINSAKIVKETVTIGLVSRVEALEENKDTVNEKIDGTFESTQMYEVPTGSPMYATNNLEEGITYKVKAHIGTENWVIVGFGESNTTEWRGSDFLGVFESLTVGEYELEFVAPNPSTYPYIVTYKGSALNSAEIVREIVTVGLEERMEDAEEEIDSILASREVLIDEQQIITFVADSVIDTRSNPILCDFAQGDDVYLDVHGYNISYVNLMVREKGKSTFTVERLTQEDTTSVYLNRGDRHWFVASKNIEAIAFYAAASVVTVSGTVNIRVRNKKAFFVNSQLNSKKILMFGDSITQLPRTGSATNGKGIVEFFADITGANVVRCAIGGSKLSRSAPVTQVTNAIEASNAVQICSMVELSMTGRTDLLTAAAPYLSDNYAKTIPVALAAVDMNTVDAITIFGGTNDMTANVVLNNGDELDTSTIEGAINTIVKSVHENYPHIKIFVFTPIVRYFVLNGETTDEAAFATANWSDVYQNSISKHLYDYADEVINVAKANHIPVCDLYRGMNWDKYSYIRYLTRKAVGTNIDGTHPRFGFDKIAQTMASFMAANW